MPSSNESYNTRSCLASSLQSCITKLDFPLPELPHISHTPVVSGCPKAASHFPSKGKVRYFFRIMSFTEYALFIRFLSVIQTPFKHRSNTALRQRIRLMRCTDFFTRRRSHPHDFTSRITSLASASVSPLAAHTANTSFSVVGSSA